VIYFGPVHELEKRAHPHIKEFLAMDRCRFRVFGGFDVSIAW
jgi:hypothetical protein